MKNRGLGRGLSSLLKEELAPIELTKASNLVSLDLIEPNKDQPRKYFDENKIKELTKATIRCIPLDSKEEVGRCILTGNPSKQRVLFAKAY